MRSEAERSFQHGFDLTEQEYRRILDALTQQIEKLGASTPVDIKFEVKFKNGVISNPSNLDELFSLENIGSGAIVKVKTELSVVIQDSISSIKLEFADIDDSSVSGSDSITYKITGDDRDWVFITSSQLDERIARVKRFTPNSFLGGKKRSTRLLIFQLFILLPVMFVSIFYSTQRKSNSTIQALDNLEARWLDGEFEDIPRFFLELERVKLQLDPAYSSKALFSDPFLLVMGGILLLLLALLGVAYIFPFHNFVWGDYIKTYQSRKTWSRVVLGSVLLALIISILANYLNFVPIRAQVIKR